MKTKVKAVKAKAVKVAPKAKAKAVKAKAVKVAPKAKAGKAKAVKEPEAPKTRKAIALELLKTGTTLEVLMEKFGWLRHTSRGFLSVLNQTHKLNTSLDANGKRVYKLA